eukprot:3345004-Prymnesium_polylepis.1
MHASKLTRGAGWSSRAVVRLRPYTPTAGSEGAPYRCWLEFGDSGDGAAVYVRTAGAGSDGDYIHRSSVDTPVPCQDTIRSREYSRWLCCRPSYPNSNIFHLLRRFQQRLFFRT